MEFVQQCCRGIVTMIVRPRPSIFTLLVSMKGSIVPAITPKIIVAALWACVAAIIREEFSESPTDKATFVTFTPFTALGVAISLFLGFRNNACYDRCVQSSARAPRL